MVAPPTEDSLKNKLGAYNAYNLRTEAGAVLPTAESVREYGNYLLQQLGELEEGGHEFNYATLLAHFADTTPMGLTAQALLSVTEIADMYGS